MRAFIVPALSLAVWAGTANAADFFTDSDPASSYVPTPVMYDWNGGYLGLHLGYGWGESDPSGFSDIDTDGWLGGIQAGYNYLYGAALLGVEFDATLADIAGSRGPTTATIDWAATARLRAGYTIGQFLLYGTGGLALGGVDINGGPYPGDETQLGWTAGLGGEVLVSPNITVRAEYLHYDFGNETFSGTKVDTDADVFRIGASFKF